MSNQRGDAGELDRERAYVSMLYERLDDLRARTSDQLDQVMRQTDRAPQARMQRDVTVAMHGEQLSQYNAVDAGLCFGRLDFEDGDREYVGRLGILDPDQDYRPLLIDWRAPAARPYYLATAARPEGVRRRRHFRTAGRRLVDIDDELLNLTEAAGELPAAGSAVGGSASAGGGLAGEAVLLAAVTAGRTDRMRDIVATIQAEQDRIIRADDNGILVVQGGPGTGKTAVALHRTAYLLYTHRERLAKTGVLVVGPNTTFLRYIEQVLPSLGETGVWLATIGDLYPGVRARRAEPAETAEIKGRLEMVAVLTAAVRDRQTVPERDWPFRFDQQEYVLEPAVAEHARARARASEAPHNRARPIFEREIVEALANQVAGRLGADPLGGANFLDEADVADIRRELNEDDGVRRMMDALWPILTPEELLDHLFAEPDRIASAAPGLTVGERAALVREPGEGWTPADVPMLDEAADLLGKDDRAEKAAAEREKRRRIDYAQGVLDIMDLEDDADEEILMAYDLVAADQLADRHRDGGNQTVAERAAADRTWTLGHIVVDEAQEVSALAWRMLMKRAPNRSMTLVGDVAQTGDLAGARSWGRTLTPYVADRWRLEQLTVNYRTPAEIMTVASDVLAGLDVGVEVPRSVRREGVEPWRLRVPAGGEAAVLGEVIERELAELSGESVSAGSGSAGSVADGLVAVLVPEARLAEFAAVVPAGADSRVRLSTVRAAKGLEFDVVLVVDPAGIVSQSPRGRNDLYVALTRATRRLGILYAGTLPAELERAEPLPDHSRNDNSRVVAEQSA